MPQEFGIVKDVILIGDNEANTLDGYLGDDIIRAGNNTLEGNAGDDLLMGALGADLFKFTSMMAKDTIAQFKTENLSFDATTL